MNKHTKQNIINYFKQLRKNSHTGMYDAHYGMAIVIGVIIIAGLLSITITNYIFNFN